MFREVKRSRCCEMKTNCAKPIARLRKATSDKLAKRPCPACLGSQEHQAPVPARRRARAQSAETQWKRPLLTHCPALQACILLPKPLGSSYHLQRHLARITSGSCQRIYKRKAKPSCRICTLLLQQSHNIALLGNGTKQRLSRCQRYLLGGSSRACREAPGPGQNRDAAVQTPCSSQDSRCPPV